MFLAFKMGHWQGNQGREKERDEKRERERGKRDGEMAIGVCWRAAKATTAAT